ncbi:hypothetical protein D6833_04130 [Candidatus Parcubacteria bacterium]|nr:MAG: hypothetical protein D6833_04130 [Candidatus Parcubacteria bacterium]
MKKKIVYRYVGNGASVPHIPSRDLTDQDLERLSWVGLSEADVEASGLYERVEDKPAGKKSEVKNGRN